MVAGSFTPSPDASRLARAPHANRPSTPVTVRHTLDSGLPTTADNDPKGSGPQGMAVRFRLGEHEHTDVVAHAHNGLPARTGEGFLAFLTAVADGPDAAGAFLAAHPAARRFAEAPKPVPSSFARQAYFAVTAFRFTSAAGETRVGRFRLIPEAGVGDLTLEQVAVKSADSLAAELSEQLAAGPARPRVAAQLAGRRRRAARRRGDGRSRGSRNALIRLGRDRRRTEVRSGLGSGRRGPAPMTRHRRRNRLLYQGVCL